jgi:hypothetical protein
LSRIRSTTSARLELSVDFMTFAIVHPPCLRGAALFLALLSQGERIVRLRGNLDHGPDKVVRVLQK